MQLLHGDCLEILPNISDNSVDMILCDLPYGTTQNKWDSIIDLSKLWIEYKRIIKSGGVIALFSQMPFTIDLVNSCREWFRYEWIWQKSQGTGFLNANRMPLKIHENIMIFYDKLGTYNPQFRTGSYHTRGSSSTLSANYGKYQRVCKEPSNAYYPIDIVTFDKSQLREHPTQKPVDLCEYLIMTYTNKGETVLDNTMGSGSTGVACVNTGRDFIGIELDKGYYDIACKRIEQAKEDKEAEERQLSFG